MPPNKKLLRFIEGVKKTYAPDRKLFLPRTNKKLIRDATLFHGSPRALCGIPAYPRQLTHAHALRDTKPKLFGAPSAAHLMQCLLPGFQHPGLSGKRICTFTPASTVCNVIPRTTDICQYQKYTKEASGMPPFLYAFQKRYGFFDAPTACSE